MKFDGSTLKFLAQLMTSVALTLLIIALGQARFIESISYYSNTGRSVTIGAFSSCVYYGSGFRCDQDAMGFDYRTNSQPIWSAFQAFILLQVIFHGITLIVMRRRPYWIKDNHARAMRIKIILPMMQLSVVVFGAIALALVCSARYGLENTLYNWSSFTIGPSLKLQIAAYPITVVAFLLYSFGWCCEPKKNSADQPIMAINQSSNEPALSGFHNQQVAININGQTMIATLSLPQPVVTSPVLQAAPIVYMPVQQAIQPVNQHGQGYVQQHGPMNAQHPGPVYHLHSPNAPTQQASQSPNQVATQSMYPQIDGEYQTAH